MAQNMMTPLATSLLQFQLKKMFKNMVCILGLFGLATVLATFQKILGDFFSIHLVTLIGCPHNETFVELEIIIALIWGKIEGARFLLQITGATVTKLRESHFWLIFIKICFI
jgi:hypothetical protein